MIFTLINFSVNICSVDMTFVPLYVRDLFPSLKLLLLLPYILLLYPLKKTSVFNRFNKLLLESEITYKGVILALSLQV